MENSKMDRRVRNTKKALRRALTQLMQRKEISRITVKELCELADINRGTFYAYYKDPFDLLEQLEDEILGQIRVLVQQRLLFEDQLDFSHHMGFIVELAQRFNAYMPRLMAGDPSFEERLKEIIAPLLDRFILPEEGLSPREQDVLRAFYLSGLLGAVGAWMADPDSMPISRLIELIVGAAL